MSPIADRIGFMQGRLSPLVDGRIQAFPGDCWRDEFWAGRELGFTHLEWTLDQDGLFENPLMTIDGGAEIASLSRETGLKVSSVTGDCFMQAPFWTSSGGAGTELLDVFRDVVRSAARVGATLVVVPLVDNGALITAQHEAALVEGMNGTVGLLAATGVRVAFESDFEPKRLASFIAQFPTDRFGINFDIGNSASLGWPPEVEIPTLGSRIINVHVKDRVLGGTTVPLGDGAADLPSVFRLLAAQGYGGLLILQTARAADGNHAGALERYRRLVIDLADAA